MTVAALAAAAKAWMADSFTLFGYWQVPASTTPCTTDSAGPSLGWLSSANRIGRLHSLYVNPQFRGIGIGLDILYARLIWLKSMRASSAFSEISRENLPSSRIALKGGMSVSGQVFQYFKKDPSSKTANPAYRL
jgi:GNAT superfamily N-acetyltransferase